MSASSTTKSSGGAGQVAFLLRRLHSLTGIAPIGVFLLFHLVTNSSVAWGVMNSRMDPYVSTVTERGVATFVHEVDFINNMPFLILIEITLWVSIAFHSILGWYYATTGKGNTKRYAFQDNWRYTLQRWSGYIGVFFVFYHVATLRWGWTFLIPGGTKWDHHYAASTLAAAMQGSTEGLTALGVLVSAFYFLGVTMLVFHFANGLWTAAITWGITISEAAQRRWGVACAGLGAALMLAGWSSVFAFATLDYERTQAVETRMLESSGGGQEGPPEFDPTDEDAPKQARADGDQAAEADRVRSDP